MPKLSELIEQRTALKQTYAGRTLLIYGDPKTGKTRLAASVAKIPTVKSVLLVDLDNGWETLMYADNLTEEEKDKITIVRVPDTQQYPVGALTVLQMMTKLHKREDFYICEEHVGVNCKYCKNNDTNMVMNGSEMDDSHVTIIDTLGQVGESIHCHAEKKAKKEAQERNKDEDKWAAYRYAKTMNHDLMTMIQQASHNIICITHVNHPDESKGDTMLYPNMGSRNFSSQIARYFGSVIFAYVNARGFNVISSPKVRGNIVAGSRTGVALSESENPTLGDIWNPTIGGTLVKPKAKLSIKKTG